MPLTQERRRSLRGRFANARRWRAYNERQAEEAAARYQRLAEQHRAVDDATRAELLAGGIKVSA